MVWGKGDDVWFGFGIFGGLLGLGPEVKSPGFGVQGLEFGLRRYSPP